MRFSAGFTDTRLEEDGDDPPTLDLRKTSEAMRGRALEVYAEGASGMQLSNPDYTASNFRRLYTQLGNKYDATGSADNESGSDLLQFASFMGRGDNPGAIPNHSSYFSSYFAPSPQPASAAAVATPDAPWVLPAGRTKRWEFRLGRGNKQRRAHIYVRTEHLTQAQRDGALYVRIENPTLGHIRFALGKYYAAMPVELIDPKKFRRINGRPLRDGNGSPTPRQSSDAYQPRMLRFSSSSAATIEQLLAVPTLEVDVVNDSNDPVSLEDVFVHATLEDAVPDIITGVHPF